MRKNQSIEDRIYLTEYNPVWPDMAKKEISILHNLFSSAKWLVDIQHIGSTAIPELAAKPVIDIYAGVTSLNQARYAIKPLTELGYQFWKENPNREKMFFVKGMPPFGTGRTHHIHIVRHDSQYWRACLLFRDYMRKHPEEITVYARLKYELANTYSLDWEAYIDAKTSYITAILAKAGFVEEVQR